MKVTKEGENVDLPFTDTQRISTTILAEILGCNPGYVMIAAELENVQTITGPKKSEEFTPPQQIRVRDVPHIVRGLQRIASQLKDDVPQELSPWVKQIDTEHDFQIKTSAEYTVLYQYEAKEPTPA